MFIVFIELDKTHPRMFSETIELLERTSKIEVSSMSSFFEILSYFLIDRWFKGPLTYWLQSLMFFKVFLLTVQGSIDLLASFFDILSCILIDGQLTYWLYSLMFFHVF